MTSKHSAILSKKEKKTKRKNEAEMTTDGVLALRQQLRQLIPESDPALDESARGPVAEVVEALAGGMAFRSATPT